MIKWARKLHGIMDSRWHDMGVGNGIVGVGEWVFLTLCLAFLSFVSPLTLTFLSSFFLFFFLVFLLSPFGVGLLTTESWECVCVCVFLIDLPRSWALGLAGWWAWGVHDFWEGGPSPFFFLFSENFTYSNFFFLGPGPLWAQRGSVPGRWGLNLKSLIH